MCLILFQNARSYSCFRTLEVILASDFHPSVSKAVNYIKTVPVLSFVSKFQDQSSTNHGSYKFQGQSSADISG